MKRRVFFTVLSLVWGMVMLTITHSIPALAATDSKPIRLGMAIDTANVVGIGAREGGALAIKEINAAGGVNVGGVKRPFEMVIGETRDTQAGVPVTDALLAVERLITLEKVDFLVAGPIRSEACFAARDLITQYKKISIISTGCYSPRYGDGKKYPYSFRIQGDVSFEIPNVQMKLLKYVRQKFGLNKIYIIIQDVRHARAAADLIENLASKDGFEILGKDSYPTGSADYSVSLLAAQRKGAQMIYIWADMPEINILAKQYYDLKVRALPIGFPSDASNLAWWKATEGKGEYFVVDLLWAGLSRSEATPWTMKFIEAFEKEYGREPDAQGHPEAYMGVYLLKGAIERAGSLDPDKVAKALRETDVLGVYGRMRFNENNEIIFDPDFNPQKGCVGAVIQWQKGKRITVFPPTISKGEMILPPWMK